MRFAPTDDHQAIRDAVRDLLANECAAEVVRSAWPEPDADGQGPGAGARSASGAVPALWGRLSEMGVLSLLVPEADGGMGFDEVAAALVLEETGYSAVPLPVVETMCVGPSLAASSDLRAGSGVAAAARLDVGPVVVPWCAPGRPIVLIAVDDVGDRCTIERIAEPEVSPAGTPDGALSPAVVASGVGGSTVAEGGVARLAFDRAALGTAAQLLGLSRRMLEITVSYVTERRQFGVPIGSFQAVKHHLADARLQIEFAAPAVARAAWSLASGEPTAGRDVSMAKAMASDAAHLVGRMALQCHGGIGYTVEYDLHLFLKRAWALERSWGDAAWHRGQVAAALGI